MMYSIPLTYTYPDIRVLSPPVDDAVGDEVLLRNLKVRVSGVFVLVCVCHVVHFSIRLAAPRNLQ